ncbi:MULTISPECIES: DUF6753 family protein [unclassified Tolypothrix]|uniref:DUF6753 family protein n=1 Tax=unclassified Tolypothrix TaxID=2649714 RepID=UPI0005EABBD4|nr:MULTISPECIES: DUF6753 family protein [unclassified Tolypothrix]BAY93660.1 hypothetical protein NIES3275_57020 [Microchaete diplosiphon NIES-3275]EKE99538.1 hypothetical protein FDUTEX481_09798 [Tolypothrix sp. PCC 7601]MBE9081713.1 hypothetical protein [Tolypothrix sp. LEGE 11397]UYD27480.1 hypothetical protein HGR01_05165 [Tolypothrix sp. PCC 7712]UYD36656.1 hypothetical protein HG267_13545 [Tolypothrix sp. PCC 7601]
MTTTDTVKTPQTPDDLLAEALKGKSEDFKRRVLDFTLRSGLSQDDPLFLVLVATGQLEAMLQDAPETLQLLFKTWNKDLANNLEKVEQVAVERQKVAINRAAQTLIHESLLREGRNIIYSIFPTTIIFFFILMMGFIAGISIPPWIDGVLGGGYTKVRSTALTWNELEAMNWAISSEGKFAKNLINWNRGYLENGECIKDAQKLGLVLSQYNRKAKSGFCTIWVTPPEQRKFIP